MFNKPQACWARTVCSPVVPQAVRPFRPDLLTAPVEKMGGTAVIGTAACGCSSVPPGTVTAVTSRAHFGLWGREPKHSLAFHMRLHAAEAYARPVRPSVPHHLVIQNCRPYTSNVKSLGDSQCIEEYATASFLHNLHALRALCPPSIFPESAMLFPTLLTTSGLMPPPPRHGAGCTSHAHRRGNLCVRNVLGQTRNSRDTSRNMKHSSAQAYPNIPNNIFKSSVSREIHDGCYLQWLCDRPSKPHLVSPLSLIVLERRWWSMASAAQRACSAADAIASDHLTRNSLLQCTARSIFSRSKHCGCSLVFTPLPYVRLVRRPSVLVADEAWHAYPGLLWPLAFSD